MKISDRWLFAIWALVATGVGLIVTVVGVHKSDDVTDSQAGLAWTAVGTSIVGGAVIGILIGLVQLIIDEKRSRREADDAQWASLAQTLNITKDLTGIDIAKFELPGGYLPRRTFVDAELSEAVLERANLTGCDFTGAQLLGTNLRGATLAGCTFDGADLSGADLRGAVIDGSTFVGAQSDVSTHWPAGLKPAGVIEA